MKKFHIYILAAFCLLQPAASMAQSIFTFDFSNDLLNKTDGYYTNGFRFAYSHPVLAGPVEKWFPKLGSKSVRNLATIDVFQDLYTPSTYNTNVYDPNDRPYSAVLATSYQYVQQQQSSALQFKVLVGLIGKQALGENVQNGVHDVIDNLHALGWAYQVQAGVLANIGVGYEYILADAKAVRLSALGGAEFGTYKTNGQLGATIYIGKHKDIYNLPLQYSEGKWFSHQLIVQSIATAVVHDATLQGAWFQNYTYGIPADQVKRMSLRSKLEYRVLIGRFQMGISQYIQSPEFDAALWHKWITLNLGYRF